MEADRLLQRVTWKSRLLKLNEKWCAKLAMPFTQFFFLLAPFLSVWVTPQNIYSYSLPSHASFFTSCQNTQPAKHSPFFSAALQTLGHGCRAVSAGWTGRRPCSLSLQRGYLSLPQTGHLCLSLRCEKHKVDSEGTGGPCPAWLNYFYFNLRPLLPLQCLVNTTF